MATVKEIAARIASEDSPSSTEETQVWPRRAERDTPKKTSWRPSRKVASAFVTGAVAVGTAYLAESRGIELDTEGVAVVTAALMSAVGYLIPERSTK